MPAFNFMQNFDFRIRWDTWFPRSSVCVLHELLVVLPPLVAGCGSFMEVRISRVRGHPVA